MGNEVVKGVNHSPDAMPPILAEQFTPDTQERVERFYGSVAAIFETWVTRRQSVAIDVPEVSDSAELSGFSRFRSRPCCLPFCPTASALPFVTFSKLDTQPACAPVQRCETCLTACPAWLGVRMGRYSFPVVTLSFTA
jgi:hypothetical protein